MAKHAGIPAAFSDVAVHPLLVADVERTAHESPDPAERDRDPEAEGDGGRVEASELQPEARRPLVMIWAIQKPRTVGQAAGVEAIASARLETAPFMTASARRDERADASAAAAESALRSRRC